MGTRRDDLDEAIAVRERKQAYFEALDANVPVVQDQDEVGRTKITDAVYQWFAELQLFQGKDQQGKSEKTLRAYNYRLGFFLDFTAQNNLRYLDQIDRKQLLRYVKFLREHESDLDDRTVHNVFETLNTFLRARDMLKAIAKKVGVEGAELHRSRKTYADTLHEEGVSVNTIRIRLGHESLDVTLAYLKGKDAESEEAQEHANTSSLALYA